MLIVLAHVDNFGGNRVHRFVVDQQVHPVRIGRLSIWYGSALKFRSKPNFENVELTLQMLLRLARD